MTIPQRMTGETDDPRWQWRLTDDGSYTLVETASGDAMHSGCGALAETQHVYLTGSGVRQRLQTGLATRVFEFGFGSALGWLVTADWALRHGAELQFVGLDLQLPPLAVVQRLNWAGLFGQTPLLDATWQWFADAAEALAANHPPPLLRIDGAQLQVILAEGASWCRDSAGERFATADSRFHAIYFDPFSPQSAPELWTREVFSALRRIVHPAGRLASYCVNRRVRDDLTASGWVVQRVPGPPGGKREVLTAQAADANSH